MIIMSLALTLLFSAAPAQAPPRPSPDTGWKRLAAGMEFRIVDGGPACRRGSRAIAIARFDPARWRIEPFTSAGTSGGATSSDIEDWRQRTGATVMFNAGQFYPDKVPMGLFVKKGRNFGSKPIKSWKGLLVAEPTRVRHGPRHPRAAILDLEHDKFALPSSPWRVVIQSFMLLDRDGKKRVRRSDWLANRTVVASDRDGRLLAIHTEGGWTLWDLADWLSKSDLGVRQAMSMDGGFESQMIARSGGFNYLSYGQWHIDDRGDRSLPGLKVPLPAVIGIFPRR